MVQKHGRSLFIAAKLLKEGIYVKKYTIEYAYGKFIRDIFFVVNPIKKRVKKTRCIVHVFINERAVSNLKSEGYMDAYSYYRIHMNCLNQGTVWADQDFRSSNHFYNYKSGKGLYGFSNALSEFSRYYFKAFDFIKAGDDSKASFYFGAALHLIQDSTVPQHAESKLLKEHRRFELWIIRKLLVGYYFRNYSGMKRYKDEKDYIRNNAVKANEINEKYKFINDREERYTKISKEIVKEAQLTTTGIMLDYYDKIKKIKSSL